MKPWSKDCRIRIFPHVCGLIKGCLMLQQLHFNSEDLVSRKQGPQNLNVEVENIVISCRIKQVLGS